MKHITVGVAVALGVVAAAGCWDEHCTELVVRYDGTRSGRLIARYEGPGSAGVQQSPNVQGPFDTAHPTGSLFAVAGSRSCASPALDSDQQWEAVAWLDVDFDSPDCAVSLDSPTRFGCEPEQGEPQARSTFTQRAFGLTRVELVLMDP
jgi:hypothetical protein